MRLLKRRMKQQSTEPVIVGEDLKQKTLKDTENTTVLTVRVSTQNTEKRFWKETGYKTSGLERLMRLLKRCLDY